MSTDVHTADVGGSRVVNLSFYGVRGSTPSPCACNGRYGGNTSSVVIEKPGSDPILLDLGTGLRLYGLDVIRNGGAADFAGAAFVTHMHWAHVQGLPVFAPALFEGARLTIHGPPQPSEGSLAAAFETFLRPPFFPTDIAGLPGSIDFVETPLGAVQVGDAMVTAVEVPHVGLTYGYRIDFEGVSIGYIPDHQQPPGDFSVDPDIVDAFRGVDVLVHDAQFTPAQLALRPDWGHCTPAYAVEVARQCEAKRLVLFHHDPIHDDHMVDRLLDEARSLGDPHFDEVIAASEGLTLSLAPVTAPMGS